MQNRNFNSGQKFPDDSSNDNNFGNANWMRNQNNSFNSRGGGSVGSGDGGGNMNLFGNNGPNDHFSNDNFPNDDDARTGQHCIHMRGLPYYTDEMDVFNVRAIKYALSIATNELMHFM